MERLRSQPTTRRTVPRKLTAALLLGLLAVILTTVPTLAGVTWCRADPIVELNGRQVQLWVDVPQEYASKVTGPIQVEISTPSAVSRQVILTDSGFNGYGEQVTFTTSGGSLLPGGSFYMTFVIRVPMQGTWKQIPVQIEVVNPDGSKAYYTGSQYAVTGTFVVK